MLLIRRINWCPLASGPFSFANTSKGSQLDAGSPGAVSMENSPPEGLGHSSWDGVCVVVLNGRR